NVRIDGRGERKQTAKIFARFLHRPAKYDRIRTGKIDVLEDAMGAGALRRIVFANRAVPIGDHHFAGLDIVDIRSADQVESTRFRCEYPGSPPVAAIQISKSQRPKAVWIAGHNHAVFGEKYKRKCPFQLKQRFPQSRSEEHTSE